MTRDASPLIDARGLTLRAGERQLVDGLDWQVMSGERWCVIGRNATGKTTLLRALAGLPVPDRRGQVLWQGRDQSAWPLHAAAAARAYMPQQAQDRFSISVDRLIDLSVIVVGERDRAHVLAALDVAHLLAADAMHLSGGERQRVALAQCALQGAPLLLLDEPVSQQDPAHQVQMAAWLVALAPGAARNASDARRREALVFTAHDVNWIARTATHVLALLGDGRWLAGDAASMMTPQRLEQVYRCTWRQVGDGLLVAA